MTSDSRASPPVEKSCGGCHETDAARSSDGPHLHGYGSRDWLRAFLVDPAAKIFYGERNRMPSMRGKLTDEELETAPCILRRGRGGDWELALTSEQFSRAIPHRRAFLPNPLQGEDVGEQVRAPAAIRFAHRQPQQIFEERRVDQRQVAGERDAAAQAVGRAVDRGDRRLLQRVQLEHGLRSAASPTEPIGKARIQLLPG